MEHSLIEANGACLEQGEQWLGGIDRQAYARACPQVLGGSVGGHMRHCLDHYSAFLGGLAGGEIDYDARRRDPAIETDPGAAGRLSAAVRAGLRELAGADLDRPLRIRMDDGGDPDWSATTLRRELQFLLSHTIHHFALMVAIAAQHGHTAVPEGFGVAPSTLRHRAGSGA